MSKTIQNIGATDLSSTYSKAYFKPGTMYNDTSTTWGNARWVWGVFVQSAVTTGKDSPCVWIPSTTNQGMFTGDQSDAADAETKGNLVFPGTTAVSGKYQWFKCQGFHTIKQSLTSTTPAQYDPFACGADKTLYTSTTPATAAGIFLENPGITHGKTVKVWLHGKRYV